MRTYKVVGDVDLSELFRQVRKRERLGWQSVSIVDNYFPEYHVTYYQYVLMFDSIEDFTDAALSTDNTFRRLDSDGRSERVRRQGSNRFID